MLCYEFFKNHNTTYTSKVTLFMMSHNHHLDLLWQVLKNIHQGCKFSGNCLNSGLHEVHIPSLLFIFSPFWRLLAQIHTLFGLFLSGQLTSLIHKIHDLLRGYCTSYPKISMFCSVAQITHKNLFEK